MGILSLNEVDRLAQNFREGEGKKERGTIDFSITFKYHASCTDGKISVRINLFPYPFFTLVPVLDRTTVKNR